MGQAGGIQRGEREVVALRSVGPSGEFRPSQRGMPLGCVKSEAWTRQRHIQDVSRHQSGHSHNGRGGVRCVKPDRVKTIKLLKCCHYCNRITK